MAILACSRDTVAFFRLRCGYDHTLDASDSRRHGRVHYSLANISAIDVRNLWLESKFPMKSATHTSFAALTSRVRGHRLLLPNVLWPWIAEIFM
jgi:hypothetical protein